MSVQYQEWDSNGIRTKRENLRKHGVLFSTEAQAVFSDDLAITVTDNSEPGEERFVSIGLGGKARLLVVVYCYWEDHIRMISARPADPRECRDYEAQR